MKYRIILSVTLVLLAVVGVALRGGFDTVVSGPRPDAAAAQPSAEDGALKGFKIP